MTVVLDFVEFKKVQPDLVINQLPVSGVLNIQRRNRRLFAEALAPALVKCALVVDPLQTEVVEESVQFDSLAGLCVNVFVISGGGRIRGRQCQRFFDELIAQFGEFGGRTRRWRCVGQSRENRAKRNN